MVTSSNMSKATKRGKPRDVHRGNFSAYQRELDSIIKDLKDNQDSKPDTNLIRSRAASETSLKQRDIATKVQSGDAKHRRQNGNETTKQKATLNHVQLEKLESTAFAALQVIQNTVVSIDKLHVEDSHDGINENTVDDRTTHNNSDSIEKKQKGTVHQRHHAYRRIDSKLRNLGDHRITTNVQTSDHREVKTLSSRVFKPIKASNYSESCKTFPYEPKEKEIFQQDSQTVAATNRKPKEIAPDINNDQISDELLTDLQLQSAISSTQPISHAEKGNLVVEAKCNARTKIHQSHFQKSMTSSSLRSSSDRQKISTRTQIDKDTVRSKPNQSGSDSIHINKQHLIESSTQTDVNLDASLDITHSKQNDLSDGLHERESDIGRCKSPVASNSNELQRSSAESDSQKLNDENGERDLQEELDKLKEGNEDLERQLKETIDFEVQAMKAYIKLVRQHRQLKRKLQERSDSNKAKTMMPEGPKANGRIQTNVGAHEVGMVGVCATQSYLPSTDSNQNHHQLSSSERSNELRGMPAEKNDEADILLRGKPENLAVESDESVYEQLDIVGDSSSLRYPWQQDVTTQCGSDTTRNVSIQTEFTEICEKCYTARALKAENSSSILNRVFRKNKLSKQASFGHDSAFVPHRHASISVLPTGKPLLDIKGMNDYPDPIMLSMPNINTADPVTPSQRPRISPFSSPFPSPDVSKKTLMKEAGTNHPTFVLSYHPDDSDSLSGRLNGSSQDDSTESVTSNGSSLRVPSPELIQSIKSAYPRHHKIEHEDHGEEEESIPPPRYRRQRRDAVISQVPAVSEMSSEEHESNNYKPDSPPQTIRNATTPGFQTPHNIVFLLPTVSRKPSSEHRASIMSEASITLASVAAQHVQGFIESSVQGGPVASEEVQDSKKKIAAMLRKKFGKQEKSGMGAIISNFKRHDQDELEFAVLKDQHWTDFIESRLGHSCDLSAISKDEYKRREKVWEVFRSECSFLVDHILVVKEIFQERLRWLQCEDHLMHIEIVKLFANVDELFTVSANLCRDLIKNFSSRLSDGEFGQAEAIVAAFATFEMQVCPAYSSYCMNYSGALLYLESLKKQDDFAEFCKLCEQDSRCKRLQLTDLLITPIQRITKYTLLLRDIRNCTLQTSEKDLLQSTLTSVESALGDLEGKVEWLANFERMREVQQMISWPSVEELDSKLAGLIPEFLKSTIAKKSRDHDWFSTKRSLIYEGHLHIFENGRLQDVYVLLFDDMLLITRKRRLSANKKKSLDNSSSPYGQPQNFVPKPKEGFSFVVCKSPLPLDRLELVDIDAKQALANGIKHCFVLVQLNRYGQVHTLYAFSGTSEANQQTWLGHLRDSRTKWIRAIRGDSKSKEDKERKKTL